MTEKIKRLNKIEKLGNEVIVKTLELFRDKNTYTDIAKIINKEFKQLKPNLIYKDVMRFLSGEVKEVKDYVKKKKALSRLKMDLLLDNEGIILDDLEKLQDQQKKIEDQERPDLYKQTKAMVDLAEAKQNIIKKYKSIVEESESKSETPKGDTNILNIFGDKDKEVMKKLMGGMNFEIPKQVKKEEIKEVKVDVEN